MLLTFAVIVAAGYFMWPRKPIVAGLCIAFFGIGFVLLAVNLHPRASYLILGREGFTFAKLFRQTFVPWSDVASFVSANVGMNGVVAWSYTPEFKIRTKWRRSSLAILEGALPDTYGMKVGELCAMMNALRERYGNHGGSTEAADK